jgi:hypothetical protein
MKDGRSLRSAPRFVDADGQDKEEGCYSGSYRLKSAISIINNYNYYIHNLLL